MVLGGLRMRSIGSLMTGEDREMSKIKVDWVPVGERLPDDSRTVWINVNTGAGISRIDYGFYTGVAWFRGIYNQPGVTHWAEIEWPDSPEPKRIETRVKITRRSSDGFSHEAVFIAKIPRSFIGKTLNVVLEKV